MRAPPGGRSAPLVAMQLCCCFCATHPRRRRHLHLLQVSLCEDPTELGTPFYLMRHVSGRVYSDPRLPGLQPRQRAAVSH